jgi:hypothetical protein
VQYHGAIAKRLCNGLQIRLVQFDSGSRLQDFAGIAQLVERNLAKVEVASSSLVSRSSETPRSARRFACAPSMGAIFGVQVPGRAGHSEASEAQLREGDRAWEGSAERKP